MKVSEAKKRVRISWRRTVRKMDILGGDFLYKHRLALGKLAQEDELAFFEGAVSELHGFTPKPMHYPKLAAYLQEIISGLNTWVEREKQLHYEPTSEERQAGIAELGRKLGEFSTIDTLSQRQRIPHDAVLEMDYITVYMMLLKDLELGKLERRIANVYEKKRTGK